jgi:hypothetical protein
MPPSVPLNILSLNFGFLERHVLPALSLNNYVPRLECLQYGCGGTGRVSIIKVSCSYRSIVLNTSRNITLSLNAYLALKIRKHARDRHIANSNRSDIRGRYHPSIIGKLISALASQLYTQNTVTTAQCHTQTHV